MLHAAVYVQVPDAVDRAYSITIKALHSIWRNERETRTMKEITLNGKFMASESSAQEYLFDVFDFPEYYGNDLEGFYDALTDITEETHVTIINRECMENTSYGSRLMWVFGDAASDNDNLSLAWTEVSYEEY